jgi:hypothetical protein
MPAVWNPADRISTIVLTNNNKTAARNNTTGGQDPYVRALNPKNAGKWVVGFRIDAASASKNLAVGIATAAYNTYVGDSTGGANSYGIYSSGAGAYNGAFPNLTTAFVPGDLIVLAFDGGARRGWISKNGVGLNGSPEAGTGGQALIGTAAFYPVCQPTAANGADRVTLADDFPIPNTFTLWDGETEILYKGAGSRASRYLGSRSDAALYLGPRKMFP